MKTIINRALVGAAASLILTAGAASIASADGTNGTTATTVPTQTAAAPSTSQGASKPHFIHRAERGTKMHH